MKTTKLGAAALGIFLMCSPALLPPAIDSNVMLGRSPDDIIEMFGVPDIASASPTVLSFTYTDKKKQPANFAFHDDVAIQVPDDGFAPLKITTPPKDKIYRGQSVRAAALRFGNIESISIGTGAASATYENGSKATIALGRVFPH